MATSEQIFEDLLVLHARREPAFLWGPPGIGKSGHVGRKIAATLASTGTPAFFK